MGALTPETCCVAFKEWAGVCEALTVGRQSLILRKGGIEEGPDGFQPEQPAFWLYPTAVHQAQQGLKPDWQGVHTPASEGMIPFRALAAVDLIGRVEQEERLADLDDMHVWTAETVRTRFFYRKPGLWVLGVRVFRRDEPILVPVTPEHAGCKTWVPLETALETSGLTRVLDDQEFKARMDRLRGVLEQTAP